MASLFVQTLAMTARQVRIAPSSRNRVASRRCRARLFQQREISMTRAVALALALSIFGTDAFAQGLDSFYKLGPDSMEQKGVPHGKLVGPLALPCQVYPGTAQDRKRTRL